MRRALIAALLGILLVATLEQRAGAHGAFLYGVVSLRDLDLAVSIADPYGGLIPDALVTAATSRVDRPSPPGARLVESPAGTYSGRLVAPGTDLFQITLELKAVGEIYRGVLQVSATQPVEGQRIPLVHVEQGGSWPWTAYLYLVLVFLLGIAVAMALRRKRLDTEGKEEE